MNIFIKEHTEILLMMLKHEVEFILVGGYAVIYYGYARTTEDMDIWLKPDNENKLKLIKALCEIGIIDEQLKKLSEIDFTKAAFFLIGEKPYKIDFLTKIQSVEWDEAIKKIRLLPYQNVMVPIIYYHHLIVNKMLTDRLKDKADVEELQKINKYRRLPYE